MPEVKLEQKDLAEVVQLDNEYNTIYWEIGQLCANIGLLEDELSELTKKKADYIVKYKVLEERQKTLAEMIQAKYGQGTLDMSTGILTSS